MFARVTKRTVSAYAERTFGHLLSLNPRFHVQRNTGMLAVLVVMAVGYSLWFTLVIIVTFFAYAAHTTLMTQRREVSQRRVNEMDSHASGRMVDSLLNYETVKTYAREEYERRRYAGVLGEWVEHSVRNQKALSALHVGQGAIIACGVASVMLLAADYTMRGLMTVGDLVLVNSYVIQICLPLNALGFVFREARDALVNTEKLFALLEQRPEIEIVVMDQGRIVERGRHDELLARAGLYAQLWNLQRQQRQFERLQRELARQPVNLAVLLAGAIDGLRGAPEARGVAVYTDVELENARVTGDPSTLAQALAALLESALDATPDHGRIELRLVRQGGNARLSVTDGRHARDGLHEAAPQPRDGAPPDPLELRSTIERQGGTFAVEPPSAVHGMRYVMELPLRAVDADALPALSGRTREPVAPGALRDLRVMSIDDQADAREALSMLLELEGALVLSFGRGRDALAWLEEHDTGEWPQAVVCDIALGEEDGHEVMRRIRHLEAQRGVPLPQRIAAVAVTGFAQPADRVRSLMAGFQVHLAKPVDPQELVSTLYSLSGRAGPGPAQVLRPTGS